MIDLYTWSTPNGRKVSIMLEECALPYTVHPVNIGKGEQHTPEFLAINPNNRIPAIVDSEGPDSKPLTLFESGAILIYLGEKTAKFIPKDVRARLICLQWLMFQMGGVGPMFGQAHHFIRNKEVVPYGIKRYTDETRRLYSVMNKRLGEAPYLAGEDYTIADIATFPWVARFEWHKVDLNDFPAVKRWFDRIYERPAVEKGMAVPTPP
ncbi:MAG: glutathione S-transferase family protein [Burkholderiales bacterium]